MTGHFVKKCCPDLSILACSIQQEINFHHILTMATPFDLGEGVEHAEDGIQDKFLLMDYYPCYSHSGEIRHYKDCLMYWVTKICARYVDVSDVTVHKEISDLLKVQIQ